MTFALSEELVNNSIVAGPDADVVVLVREVVLGGGHRAGGGVPVEAGDVPGGGREVLQTVLARRPEVGALVLSHLDLPLSRRRRGPRVDVNVDGVALI